MKTWRPKNWGEKYKNEVGDDILNQPDYCDRLFEAGADAMHKADIEHIKDNCGLATLNLLHGDGDWKQWLNDCFKEE